MAKPPSSQHQQALAEAAAVVQAAAHARVAELLGRADPAFADKMLGTFLDNAGRQAEAIRSALADADWDTVSNAAHQLKSGAASVGLDDLSAQAKALNDGFRAEELDDPHAATAAFLEALDRTVAAGAALPTS